MKREFGGILFALLVLAFLSIGDNFTGKPVYANSGTNVGGIISQNTTWTRENSPYNFTGNVFIEENITLTIEPGVTVHFNNYYMAVGGRLIANGTENDKIRMFGSGKTDNWNGRIVFMETSNNSIMQHVEITSSPDAIISVGLSSSTVIIDCIIDGVSGEFMTFGIVMYAPYTIIKEPPIIANNTILHCHRGIHVVTRSGSSSVAIDGNIIKRNDIGIGLAYDGSSPIINNNIISENVFGVILDSMLSDAMITKNLIANNSGTLERGYPGRLIPEGSGILIISGLGNTVSICNNTVCKNEIGVNIRGSPPSFTYNNIFGNWKYNVFNRLENDISASNNWWGTTNTTMIEQTIYDFYDDYLLGKVKYSPFLNSPSQFAPGIPLIADFIYIPSEVYIYGVVTFNASASFGLYSTIVNYTWDFGDGTVSSTSSPIVNHTFTSPGDYVVNLTVTDELGLLNNTAGTITVLQDTIAPAVANPTHMPSGDVQPHQEVKISVSVSDSLSGVKNVILSYSLDGSSWINVTMNFNITTNIYEATIPGQEAGTMVKYKIIAYDNAGNCKIEDNNSIYYTYTVVPEFSSTPFLLILLISSLIVVTLWKPLRKRNHTKCLNQNPFFSSVCAHARRSNIKLKGHFKCSLEIGHYQNFYL